MKGEVEVTWDESQLGEVLLCISFPFVNYAIRGFLADVVLCILGPFSSKGSMYTSWRGKISSPVKTDLSLS